jgi:hypothetical protein
VCVCVWLSVCGWVRIIEECWNVGVRGCAGLCGGCGGDKVEGCVSGRWSMSNARASPPVVGIDQARACEGRVGAWEASIRNPSIPFECVRLGLACENVVTSTLQPAVDTFDGEATGTLLLDLGATRKGFVSE